MKSRVLFVVAITIIVTAFGIITDPEDSTSASKIAGTDLYWEIDGNSLIITGTGAIPDYSSGGSPWLAHAGSVTSIQFNDGLTGIGSYAFEGFPSLNSLYIPESVTHIENYAFAYSQGITRISFGNSTVVGNNAFPNFTFVGNTGPLSPAELQGSSFTVNLNNHSELIHSGVSVYYHTNGGSSVAAKYDQEVGQPTAEPVDPVREHYSFVGWYSDKYLSSEYNFSQNVSGRLELYAKWNPVPYTITYHTYGGATDTVANNPVYTVETPTFILNPVNREGYTFNGWYDAEVGGNMVTSISIGSHGDIDLYAHWTPIYQVKFVSDGTDYVVYNISIGDPIPLPVVAPSRENDSKYEYTFSHWEGYTDTFTTPGATFNAVYDRMIIMNKDGSRLSLVDSEESKMDFSSDRIDTIVTMANTDSELTMTVNLENCIVFFDNAALRSLKAADAELSVSKLSYDDLTSAQKKVIGNHTVYEMKFGDNTDFNGGKVKFTVDYTIEDGKSADDLYVAYISDGKVQEEIECDYEDGKLSFSTGHLSVYTFFYREAKKTGFLADLDLGSFLTIGIIFAIALSGIILFVLKKIK